MATSAPASASAHLAAVAHQGADHAFGLLLVVAKEFGDAMPVADVEPDGLGGGIAGAGPFGTGLGALALHGGVEAVEIDGPISFWRSASWVRSSGKP